MKDGLRFRQGGNPPTNPGFFLDGKRIAWWPAIGLPDQAQASLVLLAYEAKGSTLTRDDVRALFSR